LKEDMNLFDVIIIGSGPVGLYATYYSGLRQMKTKLIDALPQLGGQMTALYPEKYIYDVAGFPKILSKELANNLIEQALQYNPEVVLEQKIQELKIIEESNQKIYELSSESNQKHYAKSVILCVGVGAFVPKKLDIFNVNRLEGKGVLYSVKELEKFRDKNILIVGGGDSAVDWANSIEPLAKKITLIHRRDQFRAHEDNLKKLFNSKVDVKLWYELKSIIGEEIVEGAIIYNNKTKEELELKLDYILLNLGFIANLGNIKNWGLGIEKNNILVQSTMETNMPCVYAAGDIVEYKGKLKLISTGFGESAIAVNYAKNFIDPKARIFPGHSSE
jgi:ferredoxin/flavodoxin---NADP+ reductase